MTLDPVCESSYVNPALASTLTRFNPFDLRNLAVPDPALGGPAVVRSAHVAGRFLVHLGDVMAVSAVATPLSRDGGDLS